MTWPMAAQAPSSSSTAGYGELSRHSVLAGWHVGQSILHLCKAAQAASIGHAKFSDTSPTNPSPLQFICGSGAPELEPLSL